MSDIFDDEVIEVGAEDAVIETGNKDTLIQPVAKRFAFIGVGACGGRIVNSFYEKGYHKSLVVNTCSQDRQGLNDDLEYIDLGLQGSGKDPTKSRECVLKPENKVQLMRFMDEILGDGFDVLYVALGCGGGTGSGAGPVMMRYAQEYIALRGSKAKVGCILSLPMPSEGSRVAKNALYAYAEISKLEPTPLLLIDNGRVQKLHKSSISSLYKDANKDAVDLLHTLNVLAATPSMQTFDGSDFSQLLNSGLITLGVSGISKWHEGADVITSSVVNCFKSGTLCEVDASNASQGVLIIVAGQEVLDRFSVDELVNGLNLIKNSSKHPDMMLHPAIYLNPKAPNSLRIYVALGGLKPSKDVFVDLARIGNVDLNKEEAVLPSGTPINSKLAKFFGFE